MITISIAYWSSARTSKVRWLHGPADGAFNILICLGLQHLTMPPDLHLQGLRSLGCSLGLDGRGLLLPRAGFLRCADRFVCCAAQWLLLVACPFSSNAMPPTLLCQGDGCLWALTVRPEPHSRSPTGLPQHLASRGAVSVSITCSPWQFALHA